MKKFRKLSALLLAMIMLLSIFALTGCGDSTEENTDQDTATDELTGWAYVEDKGELIIGLDDTFAPMGFRDESGNLVGFDIDLATAVGEVLGVEVTFQPIDWDAKELELEAKNIDCIWNGMSATEERQESMALTKKYLNNRIIIMTLNPDINITEETQLVDYTIGTQVDSSALESMQASENYDLYAANVSDFPTYDEAIMALQGGRVDVIVVDQVLGEYKNSKLEEKMSVCDFDFGDDFYAIGCRKGETDLADKISDAIGTLIENGQAEEISNKWFGKNIVILEGYDE